MFNQMAVVSQTQLLERSSEILADCSGLCLQLQDVLSPILGRESQLAGETMEQMQVLDRLSQQLGDLSNLFLVCSPNFDERPAGFGMAIHAATKLVETREKIFGTTHETADSGDLDLF